jgi:hypothetical protein
MLLCAADVCMLPLLPAAVPSTQYKTVLDALRARKERFTFEDVEIGLKPSVMAFITMNPGYPGRAGALRLCSSHNQLSCVRQECNMRAVCVPALVWLASVKQS